MSKKELPPATGPLAGPHLDKRPPKAALQPERTDDMGPGRDDRSEIEIEIDQAEERPDGE